MSVAGIGRRRKYFIPSPRRVHNPRDTPGVPPEVSPGVSPEFPSVLGMGGMGVWGVWVFSFSKLNQPKKNGLGWG